MTATGWACLGRSECGSALIEMALVSPLLLLLVLGVGDFGRILYHGITLSNAARAGAAYGAQSTLHLGDAAGIQLAAEEEAQNIGPITVTSERVCECASGTAVACTTASCSGYGAPMAFVRVTTSTTFTPISASFPGIPDGATLTRVAKVRAQ